MISALVYLLFCAIWFVLLMNDTEKRFCALFLGTVLFPSCVWIIDSPKVSPQHILLYSFFAVEFLKNYNFFIKTIKEIPIKIPLLLIAVSFCCTVYTNEGLNPKEFYALARHFIELYGYVVAAFLIGRKCDIKEILRQLFVPLLILGCFGIIEALISANYPYKFICSAFPNYSGFYDLGSDINVRDSWRIRTILTTTHPTAYSTLLCSILALYVPLFRNFDINKYWKLFFYIVLFANLFLCGSRTGILCTGIILSFWIVHKMHIIIKLTIVFILALSASIALQKVIDNFSQESRGSSLQLRQQQLIFSIIQIANKPLFGNGVSYLTKNIFETDAYGDRIRDEEIMGMESIVFPKLINYGFIGFGTYLLLSAWIFLYFYRRRELHPMTQSGYLLIFSITMFFILTGNMGNASAYSYMILGVLMGCTQTLEKESKEEEDEPKQIESDTAQQDVG